MKSILCYGDSNTWGFRPDGRGRYGRDERWTGVLQAELGPEYYVIEEGLNGRTTIWDDPFGEGRNGKTWLLPCLETHKPLDLVVIMLGTNDLKLRLSLPAYDIAASAGILAGMVQKSGTGVGGSAPEVLLIAPPPLGKLSGLADRFHGGAEKSVQLAPLYRQVAAETGCHFLDAGSIVRTSDIDGLHWEAGEHRKFGKRLAEFIGSRVFPSGTEIG